MSKYYRSALALLQMNNDGIESDPWFWAEPARTTITGNVMFCESGSEGITFEYGDKAAEWGTVSSNTVLTYKASEQPEIPDAIAKSGLDIPFEESGRD